MGAAAVRIIKQIPLVVFSPVMAAGAWLALALTDAAWAVFGRKREARDTRPKVDAASVVIPNWNGRDLMEKYLPSVVAAMAGRAGNEVIVVDNGSEDGSAEFLRERFPTVKVVALEKNLGFGGGSNAGFRAAANDIVVLLNSDMRVAEDFLAPLLAGFSDERVFAVSCQIFFSDPARVREETGLTEGWWARGGLRVRHHDDAAVGRAYPCFYGGGGSCAFDRRKFLELGGFDELLRPFYLEDTDLGYMAWKRGWKVLYEPASRVWHEHRGTIGKKFSRSYIDSVIGKNFLLFAWKNVHEPRRMAEHFFYAWAGAVWSWVGGDSLERASLGGLWKAFLQLGGAMKARWRARELAVVCDTEAFRRPRGAYFRDRFEEVEARPERPVVVFVSPYAICPPVHGGAVFMNEALKQLGRWADVHVVVMVDSPNERGAHAALAPYVASIDFVVRQEGQPKGVGAITPFAVREFWDPALEWVIDREVYLKRAHVVQLEYTQLGQYAGEYKRLVCALFEHDVYFQSVARVLRSLGVMGRVKGTMEYLRALRYELKLLPRLDEIQTCTAENTRHLLEYAPELRGKVHDGLRAGIDVSGYEYRSEGREEQTLLFMGSFRHLPNQVALKWLLAEVMPLVLKRAPEARLKLVGSDAPARHTIPDLGGAVELVGFVEDARQPLKECALFVCPIQSGSGVRVKLLEAFAAGIPVVSTRVGAEGLGGEDGLYCALADDAAGFAARVVELLEDGEKARRMAERARAYVEDRHGSEAMVRRLVAVYRETLEKKSIS